MIHRFAAFELDEGTRELRLHGRAIFLQPRVFELLLYLIRHRDRVVGKEELLEALWPGVIVTDGSLQRAVSLARSALRHGRLDGAIRTLSRQGYRFCEAVTEMPTRADTARSSGIEQARRDYGRGAWEEAIAGFGTADREESGLEAADLERWAYAAQCAGRLKDGIAPLERAVAAHAAVGDRQSAARATLFLAHIQSELREFAVAEGWLRRAERFLDGAQVSREHGLLDVLKARLALGRGAIEEAAGHAERAHTLGRRLDDADVEALALTYWAHALLGLGHVQQATPKLDEAAAAVLGGEVSPLIGGLVYCGVVWGYRNLADWQRAAQWAEQFTSWCERSGLSTYSGSCSLHQAEVLSVRGELNEAEKAIRRACELLPANSARIEGEAYRILGDVCLARGDLDGAQSAFERARQLGYDPQPGYALLQAERGGYESAVKSLERALDDQHWNNRQRKGLLLVHLATPAARAGLLERAHAALEQLETEPEIRATPALAALRAHAWAEAAIAEGHVHEGMASLRRAIELWREIGSPLNVAAMRLRLAELLFAEGDTGTAKHELASAKAAYAELGAPLLVQRCEAIERAWK